MPKLKQFIRSGQKYSAPTREQLNSANSLIDDEPVIHAYRQIHLSARHYDFIKNLIRYFRIRINERELLNELGYENAREFFRESDEILNLIHNNMSALRQREEIRDRAKSYGKPNSRNSKDNEKLNLQELGKLTKKELKAYWRAIENSDKSMLRVIESDELDEISEDSESNKNDKKDYEI